MGKVRKKRGEDGMGMRGEEGKEGYFVIFLSFSVSKGWVGRRPREAPYLEGYRSQETC